MTHGVHTVHQDIAVLELLTKGREVRLEPDLGKGRKRIVEAT